MTKLIGQSTKFQEVLRTIDIVANLDMPVFISGKTGTGKESVAQYIHSKSKCSKLISINSSSCSKDSLNSSFVSKSVTVFLNEVSELSSTTQIHLLDFIEGNKILDKNIRLIVSSSKDMIDVIDQGKFREDLFYRLNVVPVELPTLDEREGDILVLMENIFGELVKEYRQAAPSFTKSALRQLVNYPWPGNIRELRNFCERMFLLFNGLEIDITNLPREINSIKSSSQSEGFFNLPTSGINLESVEADFFRQALINTHGNKSKAATLLGLSRDTFLYRLKKYKV